MGAAASANDDCDGLPGGPESTRVSAGVSGGRAVFHGANMTRMQERVLFTLVVAICASVCVLFGQLSAEPPAPQVSTLQIPPRSGTFLVLPSEVIDGDTVRVFFLLEDTVRFYGIQAPELHGETAAKGKKAKDFLISKMPKRPVELKIMGREKYGRILGILMDENGKSLGAQMVESANAVGWDGTGKRPD